VKVTGGALALEAVTTLDNYDRLFGPFDGPVLARQDPQAHARLYVLSAALNFETVMFSDRHWGVANAVIAKDQSNGNVYRLLYPTGDQIGLEDIT
jgi:hypothetical protein